MSPLIALAGPAALAVAAAAAFAGSSHRPSLARRAAELAALLSIAAAIACTVTLLSDGPVTTTPVGYGALAFASFVDPVAVTMLVLVSSIGWVVIRFANTYLDGEARQGPFIGWLCLTLASVLLFVQAGTLAQLVLAFVGTSLFLQRLLLFYGERPGARRAARKKFFSARLGDVALIGAAVALYAAFGTGDIAALSAAARNLEATPLIVFAAALLALAALVKSAQFPLHGWLTEVMETPTPVSALLHAGVINAGGFLLIRFADVMVLAPAVLAGLVVIGGFTALLGSLVMLTQPAVKTSLAWSTVAQMGFMLFQCGLALFPLALLHIVAHSLYKAHAFLRSGSAVDGVASIRRPGPIAVPGLRSVARAFALALLVYIVVALAFGLEGKSAQAIVLGAILIFGVAYLLAQGLADAAPWALTRRTMVSALVVALAYFAMHRAAEALTTGILPPPPVPGPLEWALLALAVASFGLVALAQATFPLWAYHPAAVGLRVHLSNGLYVNALMDRLIGAMSLDGRSAGRTS